MKPRRLSRRQHRHLVLAATAALTFTTVYVVLGFSPERWVDTPSLKAESVQWRASMAFANSALLLLAAALLVGPWHVLRGQKPLTNSLWRRDVGIWAGGLALAHMSIGLFVHTEGWAFWWLFVARSPQAHDELIVRTGLFGLTNFAGVFQALLIGMLLSISNRRALARLGAARWKWLQRLTYLAFASIVFHAWVYQRVEQRIWPNVALFFLIVAVVIVAQASAALRVLVRWYGRRGAERRR